MIQFEISFFESQLKAYEKLFIKQCAIATELNSYFPVHMITDTEMTNKLTMLEQPFCSPNCSKTY